MASTKVLDRRLKLGELAINSAVLNVVVSDLYQQSWHRHPLAFSFLPLGATGGNELIEQE